MVDSSERKIMAELNGLHNYRDASGSKPTWKHPPTKIAIPANTPLQRSSGYNPFSVHGVGANKNKAKSVGNPTSAQTLPNSIPASNTKAKREPRDHTFTSTSNNRNHSKPVQTNGNTTYSNLRPSSAVSEPQFFTIEDEDDPLVLEPVAGIKRSYEERQSSDELNIKPREPASPPHQFSKYQFSNVNNKLIEEGRISGLIPDGKNTRRVEETYGNEDNSDPISEFDSDVRETQRPETIRLPETKGVQNLVHFFENHAPASSSGPKVNFTEKMKKSKSMKPKNQSKPQLQINRVSQPIDVDSQPSKRGHKIQDPIATSTTLTKAEQQVVVQLKRVCIENSEFSGPRLQAFSSSDYLLLIKDRGKELFDLSPWPTESLDMQYTIGVDPPTIQIKSLADESNTRILTIQFLEKQGKIEKAKFEKLLARLQGKISTKGAVRNGKQLWQLAEQHRDQTAKGKETEPQLKKQKLSPPDARLNSFRYLPPDRHSSRTSDLRGEGSENEASRSASKSRSNPPPPPPPPQAGSTVALRRSTRNAPPEKPVDQDKVILVYPQGIPGAVNITNGDLARLQPGEYLNDTLIEFGLKLWLRQLEEKQPELAQQIHIFNSFFYKKLNNKKNELQAFETVRKWTSRFDIFQKKYIIVPINEHMHWYLAIIYEPEHVLTATAPDETPTRKRTRLSAKVDPIETVSISAPQPVDAVVPVSITSSELEVERNLDTDFQSSCNIDPVVVDDLDMEKAETKSDDDALSYTTDPNDHPQEKTGTKSDDDALSYTTDPNDHPQEKTGTTSDDDALSYTTDPNDHPQQPVNEISADDPKEILVDSMDVDDPIEIQSVEKDDDTPTEVPTASSSKSALEGSSSIRSVPPSSFYASAKSAKSKGKQKAKAEVDPMDIDVDEAQNKTHIFTFDSLGTNHPHAAKKLAQYLRMEAKDKKGIPNAGFATGKTAFVPVQPNFCDCGVYLLHFAQTFLTDPKKYFSLIMSQSKSTSNQERQEQWNDKQVADMRAELSSRIQDLSTVWMKERALKEEEARARQGSKDLNQIDVVNSDSEIEMPTPVKKSGRAARLRGG